MFGDPKCTLQPKLVLSNQAQGKREKRGEEGRSGGREGGRKERLFHLTSAQLNKTFYYLMRFT